MKRSISTFNRMLSNCVEAVDLAWMYQQIIPGSAEDPTDLFYCSLSVQIVARAFTGLREMPREMVKPEHFKALNRHTSAGLLKTIQAHPGPYFGYLTSTDATGHECIFVRTGTTWAFYQSNRSTPSEDFTLVPRLNRLARNWCINEMDESQFVTFFGRLTNAEGGRHLFPYRNPPALWNLSCFDFDGKPLW